jgi:hypothetical protein
VISNRGGRPCSYTTRWDTTYKRVIGDTLRSRTEQIEATDIAIAAAALNRMLTFGRPNYVRIA